MSRIRSKHTKPEMILKKKLKDFIYHPKNIFGSPDFINYKKRTIVFLDGCYWHKCKLHYIEPKSNRKYWIQKIERNVIRDREINIAYKNAGWRVKRIWEHSIKN